ncbi:hypothetical protein [Metabacillus sp. SLBN-84]
MGHYGGTTTQISSLEVGTKFYVCNGAWDGEIILVDGIKRVLVEGDSIENAITFPEGHTLDIELK